MRKSLPQSPLNLRPYECFTKLETSPYYEKHNKEFLEALEKKGINLSEKELAEKLITDELIRKILVPQLDNKKDIKADDRYYHWDLLLCYYT